MNAVIFLAFVGAGAMVGGGIGAMLGAILFVLIASS